MTTKKKQIPKTIINTFIPISFKPRNKSPRNPQQSPKKRKKLSTLFKKLCKPNSKNDKLVPILKYILTFN